MKRLITVLPVGPYKVALWETDEPIEGDTADAAWYGQAMEIVISSSLEGAQRWAVLLHELFHCVSDLYDLGIDSERNCAAMGNGLTQALAQYLPRPPRAQPPAPVALDDEPTK